MKDFYESFYAAVDSSVAHHIFCERVFGRDLSQHGFMDQAQLDLLLRVIQVGATQRVLDLGCGNGLSAEYISDHSGAHVTGLDYVAHAIGQAQSRTAAKAGRMTFEVGDINRLALPDGTFDCIVSIDTIYFSTDYTATIRALLAALRPGGRLAFLYSHGREPWVPVASFARDSLAPDKTPLAQALTANGATFRTWDLTEQDFELAQRRIAVLAELEPRFAAEGNQFICDNRRGDAEGVSQAIREGLHARYLYHAAPPE